MKHFLISKLANGVKLDPLVELVRIYIEGGILSELGRPAMTFMYVTKLFQMLEVEVEVHHGK